MSATAATRTSRFRYPKPWIADAAPTVTNDDAHGFGIGDMWTDKTNKRQYVCTASTTGAAVWNTVGMSQADVGTAVSNAAIAVTEQGAEGFHKTTFTLNAYALTMTDAGANGCHGSIKLYDFPEGLIRVLGAVVNLTTVTTGELADAGGIVTGAAVVGSIGTATVGTGNATLTTTEADIIASTAVTLTTYIGSFKASSAAPITALTDSSGGTASDTLPAIEGTYTEATLETTVASLAAKINALIARADNGTTFDGTGTAKDAYLNFAVPAADSNGNDTLVLTGTIQLMWINYGDKA